MVCRSFSSRAFCRTHPGNTLIDPQFEVTVAPRNRVESEVIVGEALSTDSSIKTRRRGRNRDDDGAGSEGHVRGPSGEGACRGKPPLFFAT